VEYIKKAANLQDYLLNDSYQYFEMVVYTVVSFFIPLFLGHPQLIVGIVVNSLLIAAALNLKGMKLLPVIISPALGALTRGVLFGPFTIYLIYMIPFIWIGNAILVFSFKLLKLKLKRNYWIALIIGSVFKAGFLFSIAYILYSLQILPVIFLTAMGLIQLTTALGGGIFAYGFQYTKKKLTLQ
jgi:hypothetical protein